MECAPGYGAPAVIESDGTKRGALLEDYIAFLKLFHVSEYFKINGGILVDPNDLDSRNKYPLMLYYALTHSDKCLIGMQAPADQVRMTLELAAIAAGGREELLAKPRMTTIVNTLSPLQFAEDALDTLMSYAEHGQPAMITPATMAGTTGPVTLAGTMAQSNAEALAGIALTQMVRRGTPVIYGCQSTSADMRTGGYAIGCPEHALCVTYGAALAKFYGLPCRGGGTPTDAKCVSVQSGYESMMVMMASCLAEMDIIVHSAGILDGHASMSFEQFVIDLEIIGMIRRFTAGLRFDEESLAFDVIREVAPAGQFLMSPHTFKHCRNEAWTPEISLRGTKPDANANEKILEKIKRKRERMLASYRKPELPPAITASLRSYLSDRGVDVRPID